MSLSFTIPEIKAKLEATPQNPSADQDQDPLADPLLDELVADLDRSPLLQKLDQIEALMAKENIPVTMLKSSCRTVMTELNQNADTIHELEPSNIRTIVDAYKILADTETMAILDKKSKATTKKPKMNERAKDIAQLAKEASQDTLDLDFL